MRGGLIHVLLFALTALEPGLVRAAEPAHGLAQLDYIADRPEGGGEAREGNGYEVTIGYQLPGNLVAFGEYEHLRHSLPSPAFGSREETDYTAGLKLTYPANTRLRWVAALAYEEERDTAAIGATRERGYDFVQGLRILATSRLELVADLHHEVVGASSNAVALGFVQGLASRVAIECLFKRSYSEGRYDNSYHLGLRMYC